MTTVCIAEDRQSEEIAIKLLLMSLVKHCPDLRVVITFPPANQDFQHWIAQFPNIELRKTPIPSASGWNVKPQALLLLLEETKDEVWWIDSDIILTGDFRARVEKLSPEAFVVSEEPFYAAHQDGGHRAKAWGFEIERLLPFTLNSGVMRVTPEHIPLLKEWKRLLESEVYRQAQQCQSRPLHLYGDQDVLTALLTSKEFSQVSIKFLRRGRDIIQYFGLGGYPPEERLFNLISGLPPFVHTPGPNQPWHMKQPMGKTNLISLSKSLYYLELSPYVYIAYQYRDQISKDLDWNWLEYSSTVGKFFKMLGLGIPSLIGLPFSIIYSSLSFLKK